jgi:SAM-dependent methyltransferase
MAKKREPVNAGTEPANAEGSAAPVEIPLSAARGIRALRERIDAGGPRRGTARFTRALTMLEGEYDRVLKATGAPEGVRWPADAGPADPLFATRGSPGTKLPRQNPGFVPTPPELVDAMLALAKVTSTDVIYDLGSGDGRIVIAAAARYGARGVGIDADPQRIAEANLVAAQQGVADLVRFRTGDLFEADIRDATVVTLYLLPSLNMELRGRLLGQLGAGTRIVSHAFDFGDWPPDEQIEVDGRHVYLWRAPERPTAPLADEQPQ